MNRLTQTVVLSLFVGLLIGCQQTSQSHLREGFGNSVRSNMAMHTINPDAGKQPGVVTMDGQRAEKSMQEYREQSVVIEEADLVDTD
jgi:type IV pilus biogenesis protein CpaD/CtpE